MKRETPLKAIRKKCLDCMYGGLTMNMLPDSALFPEVPKLSIGDVLEGLGDEQVVWPDRSLSSPAWYKQPPSQRAVKQAVRDCDLGDECALWPWRMGKRLMGDEA